MLITEIDLQKEVVFTSPYNNKWSSGGLHEKILEHEENQF